MSSGAYALWGALIGGGLTGAVTIATGEIQFRRDHRESRGKARRRLRQAARLINGDLVSIYAVIAVVLEDGEGEMTAAELATPEWDARKDVLAYHLDSGPEWQDIRQAIYALEQLRQRVPGEFATTGLRVTEENLAFLPYVRDDLDAATRVLRACYSTPPVPRRWWHWRRATNADDGGTGGTPAPRKPA